MPGIIRLILKNKNESVKATYVYSNKTQMRSIILMWQKELEGRMWQYNIHVLPTINQNEINS